MKNIFSIALVMPNWPKWKINLVDAILNIMPVLKIRKANNLGKKFNGLKNTAFGEAAIKETGLQVELIGKEHLTKNRAVTIVANHPGGADVLATLIALGREREDFVILANKLICIEPVTDIVIPVDMFSKEKVDMANIHEAYQAGKIVVFYAAGKNSRYNEEGLLRDRRWRTTFLDFAQTYNTPIHLMKIEGSNSSLFYKVSKFREKRPSLKNIPLENMFQVRELVDAKGLLNIFLSKPIYISDKENESKQEKRAIADKLYNFLYTMNNDNLEFERYEASAKSNANNG